MLCGICCRLFFIFFTFLCLRLIYFRSCLFFSFSFFWHSLQSHSFIHVWRHFFILDAIHSSLVFFSCSLLSRASAPATFVNVCVFIVVDALRVYLTIRQVYVYRFHRRLHCAASTLLAHPLISLNLLRMTESSRKLVAITSFRCVDNRVDFRLVLSNEQTNRNEDDDGYRYCKGSASEKKDRKKNQIVCARQTDTHTHPTPHHQANEQRSESGNFIIPTSSFLTY